VPAFRAQGDGGLAAAALLWLGKPKEALEVRPMDGDRHGPDDGTIATRDAEVGSVLGRFTTAVSV
jgi:hypothetical protein